MYDTCQPFAPFDHCNVFGIIHMVFLSFDWDTRLQGMGVNSFYLPPISRQRFVMVRADQPPLVYTMYIRKIYVFNCWFVLSLPEPTEALPCTNRGFLDQGAALINRSAYLRSTRNQSRMQPGLRYLIPLVSFHRAGDVTVRKPCARLPSSTWIFCTLSSVHA